MTNIGIPEIAKQNSRYKNITMKTPPSINELKSKSNAEKDEKAKKKEFFEKISSGNNKTIYSTKKTGEMGKNEFLKLLSFQIQNQDPMKPMDQAKLTADLAQFSQLEQLTQINKSIGQKDERQILQDKFYSASFLGKKILTSGREIKFESKDKPTSIYFDLEQPANLVRFRILDSKNNVVYQEDVKDVGKGPSQFYWDGETMDGQVAVPGKYAFQINAWNEALEPLGVKTQSEGVVRAVSFENGQTILDVDGKKVNLYEVTNIALNDENNKKSN